MSLNLNGNVTGIYLGSTKADAVYLGNVKVFESTPAQETVTIGGREYPVVTIGTQKWIAENLDLVFTGLTTESSSWSNTSKVGCYYNDDASTYGPTGNKYGRLYNRAAVDYMETNKATLFNGWHIPTHSEFSTLFDYVGGYSTAGTKLKAASGWSSGSSDDAYGFSAVPAGSFVHGSGSATSGAFYGVNNSGSLWVSDYGSSNGKPWKIQITTSDSMYSTTAEVDNKADRLAVRLVKDA